METCEILIIGGGPAGSSCAWKLTAAGRDVVILDKATFPRDKICAGWITPAIVDELSLDLADYRQSRTLQPITGFRTSRLGGPEIETRYDHPVSYGIRRCEFDHYLLERAGARLRLGEPFQSLRREGDAWVVNESMRAAVVIGAGGNFCPLARQLSRKLVEDEPVVLAQEIEFKLSAEQQAACTVSGEIPELFFCDDLTGYGWVFRKGDYLNVGLGRENEHNLSAEVAKFREFLVRRNKIPADLPAKFHGHAYRLYQHAPRIQEEDQVLLIGDAAGLAYPQSGEGIRPAIESGLMAADVLLEAEGNYARGILQPLWNRLTARFGPQQASHRFHNLIPQGVYRSLAGKLLESKWFTRHVVIDRWFLHRHQPVLSRLANS